MEIRRPTNEAIWKFFIVIAIGLAAGPDIFAALEMRILLEILGAALFTTAFVVGGQLLLWQLRNWLSEAFLLPAQLSVLRSDAGISEKNTAVSCLLAYWDWWLGFVTLIVFGLAILHTL